MLFACVCWDKPDSAETRKHVSPDPLLYLGAQRDVVHLGGQMVNTDERIEGNLLVIDVESQAAARAFMGDDVSSRNSIFESVKIRRFRQFVPEPKSGNGTLAYEAAKLQIRQDCF